MARLPVNCADLKAAELIVPSVKVLQVAQGLPAAEAQLQPPASTSPRPPAPNPSLTPSTVTWQLQPVPHNLRRCTPQAALPPWYSGTQAEAALAALAVRAAFVSAEARAWAARLRSGRTLAATAPAA